MSLAQSNHRSIYSIILYYEENNLQVYIYIYYIRIIKIKIGTTKRVIIIIIHLAVIIFSLVMLQR
jgi:hypothetical protein